jgi:hypothetical protein
MPYLRKGIFKAWSDTQIEEGSKWYDQISAASAKASVAVLLVSSRFLASDFIHEHELSPFLKKASEGGATILWMLIGDCAYKETALSEYQAVVSPPDKPFAAMTKPKRDTAWRRVCETIQRAVSTGAPPNAPSSRPLTERHA